MKIFEKLDRLIEKRIYVRHFKEYFPEMASIASIEGLTVKQIGDTRYEVSEGKDEKVTRDINDFLKLSESTNLRDRFLEFMSFGFKKKDGTRVNCKLINMENSGLKRRHTLTVVSGDVKKSLGIVIEKTEEGNVVKKVAVNIFGEKDFSQKKLEVSREDQDKSYVFANLISTDESDKEEMKISVDYITGNHHTSAGFSEEYTPIHVKGAVSAYLGPGYGIHSDETYSHFSITPAIPSCSNESEKIDVPLDQMKDKIQTLMSQPRVQNILSQCVESAKEAFPDIDVVLGLFPIFCKIYGIQTIEDASISSMIERASVAKCSLSRKEKGKEKVQPRLEI